MTDVFLFLSTVVFMLYLTAVAAFDEINPIKQVRRLLHNHDVLAGVVTVGIIAGVLLLLTNDVEAGSVRAEIELGLDRPFGAINVGCKADGDQTASNITIRAIEFAEPLGWHYGLAYNHQSCALAEDYNTTDWMGVTLLYDWPRLRLEGALQWEKRDLWRAPLTVYVKVYEFNQYRFSVFIQRQFGHIEESSFGAAVSWQF